MGYQAIKNCSKYKDRVDSNELADEFGEFVYNEMYEGIEILGKTYEEEIKKLREVLKELRD